LTAADASPASPGPDWLQRDRHVIDGLDQLGIQVVSINIYSSLLPGITNVTDRARYYSLYPWILHRYASRGASDSSKVEWLTWVRRIDYAYALASALAEKDRSDAGTAVVGINTARRLLRNKSDDDVIDLEPQTEVDDKGKARANAYFKNGEGGLGQYYKGAMRLLGISLESSKYRYPDWAITDYAGRPLAESIDDEPGFSGLLEIAQAGRATVRALREAGSNIHPASIPQESEEQRILRHLFLATDEAACAGQAQETQHWRSSSLRLVLDFVCPAKTGVSNLPEEFRWGALERRNASGQSWEVSAALVPALSAWSGYQRNDLMNYALESLFWVSLRKMDEGRFSPYEVAAWIADTSVGGLSEPRKGASSIEGDATVKDLLEAHGREGDPSRADLKDARSTRAWTLELSKAIKEEDDALAATLAVRLLARIAADSRVDADLPFGGCPAAPHIRAVYEVHLGAWIQRCRERSAERVRDFIAELVLEWVLFRHLRVATRKLAGQGVSTFKFRPEEGELIFVADEPTTPVFTNPRLRQATQILADLGFLISEDRKVRISEDGQALLEFFDD
jgi:hypothetical protein